MCARVCVCVFWLHFNQVIQLHKIIFWHFWSDNNKTTLSRSWFYWHRICFWWVVKSFLNYWTTLTTSHTKKLNSGGKDFSIIERSTWKQRSTPRKVFKNLSKNLGTIFDDCVRSLFGSIEKTHFYILSLSLKSGSCTIFAPKIQKWNSSTPEMKSILSIKYINKLSRNIEFLM